MALRKPVTRSELLLVTKVRWSLLVFRQHGRIDSKGNSLELALQESDSRLCRKICHHLYHAAEFLVTQNFDLLEALPKLTKGAENHRRGIYIIRGLKDRMVLGYTGMTRGKGGFHTRNQKVIEL
jgi:hypothetical protein